ncbi:PI4KG7 [Scenedesmus sp. PABB004]|nr:PI4KG7 [Scenedesmus sp. PABB004]
MFVTQQQPAAAFSALQAKEAGAQAPDVLQFSTTDTFTTTHGFVISAAPAGGGGPCSGTGASDGGSASSSSRSSTPPAAEPSDSTPVGWSGLLEISRASGGRGVVGSAASGDLEAEGEGHIEVACTAHTNTGVRRLVKAVIRGLKARQEPEAAREGMGGTYFFPNDAGRKCAIFKPCDEEPLAPANPKGYVGRTLGDPGWKSTVRVGEAAMREVAAYLLDHDHFAQVPHTVLVRAAHPLFNYNYHTPGGGGMRNSGSCASMASSALLDDAAPGWGAGGGGGGGGGGVGRPLKLGSLQEFVYHVADTNEMGSGRFRARDVHAIGILDLRLFNTDRHAGNILVREPPPAPARERERGGGAGGGGGGGVVGVAAGHALVPIDHGFCLPEALEAPYFEWLHWPQACLPFDAEELAYIARLDARADVALLQRELPNLRPECLRVLEVATTLLQRCAAAGLTLADIGALASRPLDALDGDDSRPSELEKACVAARQAVETRELTAMLSSSCSSDGGFPLREEDEEGYEDSSELEEEELELEGGQGPAPPRAAQLVDRQLAPPPPQQQQQQGQAQHPGAARPRAPSRLALASGGSGGAEMALDGGGAKAGSGDLGSVMSEATVCGLATAMSLGSNAPGRACGDGELLFDLDDDPGSSGSVATTPASGRSDASGPPRPGSADVAMGAAGASPPPLGGAGAGAAARASLEAEHLAALLRAAPLLPDGSAAHGGGAARLSVVTAGLPPLYPSGPLTPGALPSPGLPTARSAHVGDWLHGGLAAAKAAAAAAQGRCGLAGGKKRGAPAPASRRRSGLHRAMYPPPVVRAAPRATNEVLGGLSGAAWAAFMAELHAVMDEALRPGVGAWRRASEAAGLGAAAMSCPRF